jgi:hypothetical protein
MGPTQGSESDLYQGDPVILITRHLPIVVGWVEWCGSKGYH